MKKVSVIIPAHNTGQYIRRCMDSLLANTWTNLEVLTVDDGSSDNTTDILDEYAGNDSRVTVLHQSTEGAGMARNRALDVASGDYITFMDSDDYVTPYFVENLVRNLESYDADVSVINYERIWLDGRHTKGKDVDGIFVFHGDEVLGALLQQSHFYNFVWTMLFKAELLKDVRFPIGMFEDIPFTFDVFKKCRCVVFDSQPYYFYVQRKGSLVDTQFLKSMSDMLVWCDDILTWVEINSVSHKKAAYAYYIWRLLWLCRDSYGLPHGEDRNRFLSVLRPRIRRVWFHILKNSGMNIVDRFCMVGMSMPVLGFFSYVLLRMKETYLTRLRGLK